MLQVGRPVTGQNLIGRDREISLIRELIKEGQNFVMIAPRRMGKTSLVLELLKQLQHEGYYTGYIDIFSGSYESVMNELFIDKNSPFFRMARVINSGNINKSDFTHYLIKLFKKEELSVSTD